MDALLHDLTRLGLEQAREGLSALIEEKMALVGRDFGNEKKFRAIVESLPDMFGEGIDITGRRVSVIPRNDHAPEEMDALLTGLRDLRPWRKGPYGLFGIDIDTEWNSDVKWDRLAAHIAPLEGRRVLDIGASSGYYMFRMAAGQPEMVLGIDPQILFYFQYLALQKYLQIPDLYFIPAKMEELPPMGRYFDTIFCMGVIYHRKSPVDTLREIHSCLRPGGELVMETLIIEGDSETALFPEDRYAKMRNVFFIPTVPCLANWLKRAGFTNIRCVDVSPTTLAEQRKTDWVTTESLEMFLDPEDPTKTVEGYPAPIRAVVLADAE
ncbi:tRNA 5-methoxyuridine(34)/uridine 5-oxyacetic acid(34) synthase CmoB [Desulfoluna butyratoxydans]|uniref:Trna u34 carboxymethyltransferase n=1 Tax=Desulfoluna butyratoxydans TaxID=231438 RepID=A0A4U8YZ69_9BACT|nr:tRNA 5-methoxyuridine(34)/uridine 5-oxyacetic acid(34) synthase CmoB [Desulfoluna butyratoxydans]VFQ46943.1 trna u34 carboxymethyltransferase [Desulfoluna butyratoxydans]